MIVRPGDGAFKERVRAGRRRVSELRNVGFRLPDGNEGRPNRRDDSNALIIGSGGDFCHTNTFTDCDNRVGERASNINSNPAATHRWSFALRGGEYLRALEVLVGRAVARTR